MPTGLLAQLISNRDKSKSGERPNMLRQVGGAYVDLINQKYGADFGNRASGQRFQAMQEQQTAREYDRNQQLEQQQGLLQEQRVQDAQALGTAQGLLQEQRVQDAEALGSAQRAGGAETSAGQGYAIAQMLESSYGPEAAASMATLPEAPQPPQTPADYRAAQTFAQGQEDRVKAQQLKVSQDMAVMQTAGQDIALVQNYATMLRTVGTETFKTQDRGIMAAQRFQMLNLIARTTEAGALQRAEIELFQAIIPEHDEWIKISTGEREGKLQQFEHWMRGKAEVKAMALGLDFSAIPDLSRSYEEMTRPLPTGFDRGLPGG